MTGDRGFDELVAVGGTPLASNYPQQLAHPLSWKYVPLQCKEINKRNIIMIIRSTISRVTKLNTAVTVTEHYYYNIEREDDQPHRQALSSCFSTCYREYGVGTQLEHDHKYNNKVYTGSLRDYNRAELRNSLMHT